MAPLVQRRVENRERLGRLVLLKEKPAPSDRVLNAADVHLGCADVEHISERGPPKTITVLPVRATEPEDRHVDRRVGIEWEVNSPKALDDLVCQDELSRSHCKHCEHRSRGGTRDA